MSAIDVRLEALLAGDAPRDADEARRMALLDELRGATLRAPDALRARVLASAPAPRRAFVPRLSRRLVFVVVPAALGLAIAAPLVHGLTGSAPQPVALGTIVSQEISVQDLQHALEVESAQVAQLRRTITALEQALRNPALPDAQRVLLQIKLAESKRALDQRLNARKGTISAGTTARISLVIGTAKSIVVPVTHHRGRLGRMLHSALGFLGLEAAVALYALIVISPCAVLAALAWFLARLRRRRDDQRPLAAWRFARL